MLLHLHSLFLNLRHFRVPMQSCRERERLLSDLHHYPISINLICNIALGKIRSSSPVAERSRCKTCLLRVEGGDEHLWLESHVKHAVCLIEYDIGGPSQGAAFHLYQVNQPTGGTHHRLRNSSFSFITPQVNLLCCAYNDELVRGSRDRQLRLN
jgi:hypothetical protein